MECLVVILAFIALFVIVNRITNREELPDKPAIPPYPPDYHGL